MVARPIVRFALPCIACVAVSFLLRADEAKRPAKPKSVFDFDVQTITGEDFSMLELAGDVTLVVNVASRCGLTDRQYTGLNALYAKYKGRPFEIAAFPANNFGGQEPGTNPEIQQFCAKRDVKFPLFAKISVAGEDQHPLYSFLTSVEAQGENGGRIRWNFDKFLVGPAGNVIARFEPAEDPMGEAVTGAIDAALAKAEKDPDVQALRKAREEAKQAIDAARKAKMRLKELQAKVLEKSE